MKFLLGYVIALFIWAVCFGLAYAGCIPDSKAVMDSLELFGAVAAFIGFPLLGAELFKFTRKFVLVEDLKPFEERIKEKISGAFPVDGNGGRQGGQDEFKVYFTKDPDGALARFYNDNGRTWGNVNYVCPAHQAAIRHQLGSPYDDFWIVCASESQRFTGGDPITLGRINFTEAEREIMKLISKHSK